MLPEFIVTFRESMEAAVVLSIVLAYLKKTQNEHLNPHVYSGVALGLAGSVLAALLFGQFGSQLLSEEAFEASVMVATGLLVTWMTLWMVKQRNVRANVEGTVGRHLSSGYAVGLAAFAFVAVLREGIETVVFLGAIFMQLQTLSIAGAAFGFAGALLLSYLIYTAAIRFNLKLFFQGTAVILILLAAGVFAHAVHEFQEAGVLAGEEPLRDTSPVLDYKSALGAIPHALVGYTARPTPSELVAYLGYLMIAAVLWKNVDRLPV